MKKYYCVQVNYERNKKSQRNFVFYHYQFFLKKRSLQLNMHKFVQDTWVAYPVQLSCLKIKINGEKS